MRIFFNDTPLLLAKPTKLIQRNHYQVVIDMNEDALVPEKMYRNVLIVNVQNEHVKSIMKLLRKNVFIDVSSITLKVDDYIDATDFLKSCFKIIKAAGGIVRKKDKVLLIKRLDRWDLPKGKLEKGESFDEAAIREVEEECGIKVSINSKIGNTWHTYSLNGKSILKKTAWFEMKCLDDKNMQPQLSEGIEDVRWLKTRDLFHALEHSYKSIQWIFDKYRSKFKVF